jgi:hypothetical protein
LAVAAGVVLCVAGWHYWVVYSSLRTAQDDLFASETVLRAAVRNGGSPADVDRAEQQLSSARANINRSQTHIRWDPALQAAKVLPVAGRNVKAVEHVLSIADTMTAAGEEAVYMARELDAARAGAGGEADGESSVAASVRTLDRLEPNIDRISVLLDAAVRERRAVGDDALLPPLTSAMDRIDRVLPDLVASFETVQSVQSVAPAMMGFEGPRKYLVFALNNGEILPGGGLVTAAGVLQVENGDIGEDVDFEDSTLWGRAWLKQGGAYIEPPGPLKRYLLQDFPWNLAVADWSPDFPSWSQQATEMYELVHGPQEVDGAVAIDLAVVERLLRITGPLAVNVQGEGSVTFTADNAVLQLERLTRPTDQELEARKSVLSDLTSVLLKSVQALPAEKWPALFDAFQALIEERHIQVTAIRDTEQAVLDESDASGRLVQSNGDYLMVNEASLLGTKLALILERDADHTIEIAADGSVTHTLRYRVANPLSAWTAKNGQDLASALMGNGLYGLYLRVFTPASAGGFRVEIGGKPALFEDRGVDSGRLWTGVFTPIPRDTTVEVVLHWTVPSTAQPGPGPYELYLQKQPGLKTVCTSFHVSREGAPAAASIDGHAIDAGSPVCLSKDARLTVR